MKEIDFDELDRAVSSVLGTKSIPQDREDRDEPSRDDTHYITPSPALDRSEEPAKITQDAVPSRQDQEKVNRWSEKPVVQKRKKGRFMDVVPPQKVKDHSTKPASSAISRHGVTLAPSQSSAQEQSTEEDSSRAVAAKPSLQASPETTPKEQPIRPDQSSALHANEIHATPAAREPRSVEPNKSEYRDNNQRAYEDDSMSEQEAADAELDAAVGELAGLDGLMQDTRDMPPIDTPFMNDLAVEKRPLGAFSLGDTDESLLSDDAEQHHDEIDTSTDETVSQEESIDFDLTHALTKELNGHNDDTIGEVFEPTSAGNEEDSVSQELQDEIFAITSKPIESISDTSEQEPKEDQVNEDASEVSAEEELPEKIETSSQKTSATITPSEAALQAVGNGSIARQYHTQESPQSEDITPVFDTDSYRQPLQKTKQKKSGWMVVMIIALLVVLGLALGAALYFFDPFNLLA